MVRLLVLGLVFTLWSSAVAAPTNSTEPQKGIVFPKKIKINVTEKTEEPKTNPNHQTTVSYGTVSTTEVTSESGSSDPSTTDVTPTGDEEYVQSESGISTEQEEMPFMPQMPEEPESDPEEASHQEPVDSSDVVPGSPLPPDANDGLIEYNLGNPLALRLHLPWWPLKDMLRSIQDAISVMNLTMSEETLESDNTKTKIVQFDDRNYTLKVRVFKPHENNRLLVRLISLTPVIEEGKVPTEKEVTIEDEEKNEALEKSKTKVYAQMKEMDDEKDEEKKEDDDDDDDDDDKDKKEEKKKPKDSKKEKQSKKKKDAKKGSDSD